MAFVQDYTAAVSTITALRRHPDTYVVRSTSSISPARQRKGQIIELLKNEIFQVASLFRCAVADAIDHRYSGHGIYEAQRFENWSKLNGATGSILPALEDKAPLERTQDAAAQMMRNCSANLPPLKRAW
jgi:hypothetical protein